MSHSKKLLIITLATLFNGLCGMEKNPSLKFKEDDGSILMEKFSKAFGHEYAFTTDPKKNRTLCIGQCYDNGKISDCLDEIDFENNKLCKLFNLPENIRSNCLAFDHNNNVLAVLGNTIMLFNLDSNELIKSVGHKIKGLYWSGTFYNDGQQLATGTNGEVQLWDIASSECIKKLTISSDSFDGIKFMVLSSDKKSLIISGDSLSIWNHETGECIKVLSQEFAFDSAFNPNTNCLITGHSTNNDEAGAIQLWDMENNKLISTFEEPRVVRRVAFNSTGSLLASGLTNGTIRLLDTKTGDCLCTIMGNEWMTSTDELIFSHDDQHIISRSYETAYIWDLSIVLHAARNISKLAQLTDK
jgi:WD40 repeat protein